MDPHLRHSSDFPDLPVIEAKILSDDQVSLKSLDEPDKSTSPCNTNAAEEQSDMSNDALDDARLTCLASKIYREMTQYIMDDPFFKHAERLKDVTDKAGAMIQSLQDLGRLEKCRMSLPYVNGVYVKHKNLLLIESALQGGDYVQDILADIDDARESFTLKASRNAISVALCEPSARCAKSLERYTYAFNGNHTTIQEISLGDFSKGFNNLSTSDIEIFHLMIPIMLISRYREYNILNDSLGLSPSFDIRTRRHTPNGLTRRILPRGLIEENNHNCKETDLPSQVARYQLHFFLPMLDFTKTTVDMTRFDEGINEILPHFGLSSIAASDLDISLSEDLAAFHLDYDLHTRKTIILASKSVIRRDRIMKLYDQSEKLDLRSDPFAFLVCALSTVIYDWGTFSGTHFKKLDSIEQWILSLKEDITVEEVQQAKKYMFELKKLQPYNARILLAWDCFLRVSQDAVDEHQAAVSLLHVPYSTSLRVDRNLRTIVSWADSILSGTKLRIQRLDSALSTLSDIFATRNDVSLKINTETLVRMAEGAQQENYIMQEIAQSTKFDSQTMKTIATLTMLYLPATFVATFFSMGLIHFQTGEEGGGIEISRSWWIYFTITIPMTFGTYMAFNIIRQRSEKGKPERVTVVHAAELVEDKSAEKA